MMNPQDPNQPLQNEELEKDMMENPINETENSIEENTDSKTGRKTHHQTKAEIVTRLQALAQDQIEEVTKQELDFLKQEFYKMNNAEHEEAKRQFIENGGNENDFTPVETTEEVDFKRLMGEIKKEMSIQASNLERQKEENYQIKLSILEELKKNIESPENANKSYNEFKTLQQRWNEIKLVPQAHVNELWKSYQLYVEQFYDLLKLNNEFREYDFKKNLEMKLHLCEAAEKLGEESDVISAFHQLQKLHQEFREIGPVSKELRDEIWKRFKTASSIVNKRHQQHFEEIKAAEQLNLDQKTVICEIIEAIEYDKLTSLYAWDKQTQEVIALQNKWKTIGFVPQKMNTKIFERFRKACDDFFRHKGEFFKRMRGEQAQNLEKKLALCEKAESLKDSTDWRETAEELTKLQKEWKTIGPVSNKYSVNIWKRFISACDYFFEQKNKATSSMRSVEQENLTKKKAIISELEAIQGKDDEEAGKRLRELIKEWNETGHVPFKEKDNLYKQYHALVDKLFEQFHMNASNKRLNNFRSNISSIQQEGPQTLFREREKLMRQAENLKSELKTYENNLGFLSLSSKKGNSLLVELNRKVEKLKDDLNLIKEKIKMIDESIKE